MDNNRFAHLIQAVKEVLVPTPSFSLHIAGERKINLPMRIRLGRSTLYYSGDVLIGIEHDNNSVRLQQHFYNKTTQKRIAKHAALLGLDASWVRPIAPLSLSAELEKVYTQAFRDYARGRFTEEKA